MAKNKYDYEYYFDEMDRFRQPNRWYVLPLAILFFILILYIVLC